MKYLLFLFPYLLSSQSLFKQDISLGVGISSIDQFIATGATLGYSLEGKTDLYSTFLRGASNGLVELDVIIGSNYYLIQQDDDIPFSLSIGGRYTYSKLSGDALFGLEANGSFGTLSTGLYHEVKLDKMSIYPGVFMNYIVGNYKFTSGAFQVAQVEATGISGGLEVSVFVPDAKVVITPFIFFSNSNVGIGFQLAYLL